MSLPSDDLARRRQICFFYADRRFVHNRYGMTEITKKYIFKCKLAGLPDEVDTEELQDKKTLKLLVDAGVWKKDPIFTKKFWGEYAFTVLHPIRMIDDDKWDAGILMPGDHHTVCL